MPKVKAVRNVTRALHPDYDPDNPDELGIHHISEGTVLDVTEDEAEELVETGHFRRTAGGGTDEVQSIIDGRDYRGDYNTAQQVASDLEEAGFEIPVTLNSAHPDLVEAIEAHT